MNDGVWGGVHLDDRKELTTDAELDTRFQPKTVAILMQQHIGAPCTPLVRVGDLVRRGQKIGDGSGLCVPVHASVSGRVIAIEPRRHPGGSLVPAVVIENDGRGTDGPVPCPDSDRREPEELLMVIREAGIVGHGGAAFPTAQKLQAGLGHIDTLIVNACECEPYITADDVLLRWQAEQVLGGMEIVAKLLKPQRMVVAVEDNKEAAIRTLRQIRQRTASTWELVVLPTRYPQGAEKQLIRAVTGQEVPSGRLPAAVGCIVLNAATLAAIDRAVCLGEPVTRRIVTVTGDGIRHPRNILCPIGTAYQELIDACGGLRTDTKQVLCGGPMMGFPQTDLSVVTVKGTNAILCLTGTAQRENPVCIRCGRCAAACPMRLQPLYLYRFQQAGDAAALRQFHVWDCIGCGCCSYTCPGKLPLAEAARRGKQIAREGMAP